MPSAAANIQNITGRIIGTAFQQDIRTFLLLVDVALLALALDIEVVRELALVSLLALTRLEEGAQNRLGVNTCSNVIVNHLKQLWIR